MRIASLTLNLVLLAAPFFVIAGDFDSRVAMRVGDAATYYIDGEIKGVGPVEMMVDTGSGYMTINEEMLATLERQGAVRYLKSLRGRLANGDELTLPLYAIETVNIGDCVLNNVEAAVFPGKTRAILGLSALQQASPFIFSIDPPTLVLSHCTTPVALTDPASVTGVEE